MATWWWTFDSLHQQWALHNYISWLTYKQGPLYVMIRHTRALLPPTSKRLLRMILGTFRRLGLLWAFICLWDLCYLWFLGFWGLGILLLTYLFASSRFGKDKRKVSRLTTKSMNQDIILCHFRGSKRASEALKSTAIIISNDTMKVFAIVADINTDLWVIICNASTSAGRDAAQVWFKRVPYTRCSNSSVTKGESAVGCCTHRRADLN